MKLALTALLLDVAAAQVTPIRLRSSHRVLKHKHQSEQNTVDTPPPVPIVYDTPVDEPVDVEPWIIEEEFGRSPYDVFELLDDLSLSFSVSYSYSFSMPSSEPTAIFSTEEPSPYIPLTDVPSPSPVNMPSVSPIVIVTPTPAPSMSTPTPSLVITPNPTLSKSGKEPKLPTEKLLTYSWSLPDEYTGYFHLYQKLNKKESTLLQTIQLGPGTIGSSSQYLPENEYIIRIINKNQTVGYCCYGSSPGYIQFTYGDIQYDPNTEEYEVKNGKDVFVAEFDKKVDKIDVEDGVGAFYEFDFKL
jgi:hypothetical protein